jgi:PAS domain S-box-containing protein
MAQIGDLIGNSKIFQRSGLISQKKDPDFDGLVEMAAAICETRVAMITLLTPTIQYVKSTYGLENNEWEQKDSICKHYHTKEPFLIIKDLRRDPRFRSNDQVKTKGFVFYAGAPIFSRDGLFLGMICVLDFEERDLSERQKKSLQTLANQVSKLIELRIYKNEHILPDEFQLEETEMNKVLQMQNQRYAEVFMKAPAFICILKGENHVFQMANLDYELLIGKSNIIGKSFIEVIPESKDQGYIELLDSVFQTGISFTGKETKASIMRSSSDNTSPVYINFTYQPTMNLQGEIDGIFVFGIDVTEHVLSRVSLEEMNDRFNLVNRATNDAIYDWDIPSDRLFWGESYFRLFGYSQQLISEFNHDLKIGLMHPQDALSVKESLDTSLNDPKQDKWECEYRFRRCDGTYAFVEEKGYILRDYNDKAVRYIGAIRDVTENKELQNLLRIANKLSRLGSWEIDMEKNTLYWSDITKEIHEVQADFVPDINTAIQFYTEGESREKIQKLVSDAMITGGSWDVELTIMTAKGNERWVRAIGNSEIAHGKCKRIYGSFQDIHQRKVTELRLKRISDNIPGILFQYKLFPDGKTQLLFVSAGASGVWGFSPSECMEIPQKILKGIEDAGSLPDFNASIQQSATNLSKWVFRYKYVMPDGKLRWHEVNGAPHKQSDDTIVWDAFIADISDRMNLEILAENTSKMAKIGNWELNLLDKTNDSMYWSPLTKDILEVSADYNPTLTGGFEFYVESSKSQIKEAVFLLIERDIEFDLELLVTTAKGNDKWIRCIGKSERASGRCIRIYGSYQDIHSKKIDEIELIATKNKILATLDSIQDGFYELDRDWNVTYWNREAERLLDTKRDEVLGKNLWEFFSEARLLKFYPEYYRAMTEKIPVHFEEFYLPNESWFDVNIFSSDNGLTVYFKDITEKKKSELEIRKFKQIIENSLDGIAIADSNGQPVYMNSSFSRKLGYDSESIIKLGGPTAVFADKEVASNVFGTLLDGKYWNGDIELINAKGERVSFYLSAGPIYDDESKQIASFGIHTDITERKTSEGQLKKALFEKESILESIGDAFFTIDAHWIIKYWNKTAEILLNISRESVIGKNLWELFPRAFGLQFFEEYSEALENKETIHFEEYYPVTKQWFEVSAYPNLDGISVYFKDVTLRKEWENQIRLSNERFEKVTEATNDAIWDWDIENESVYYGDGFRKLFGYTSINTTSFDFWSQHIEEADKEAVIESLKTIIEETICSVWQIEYRFKKSNGEKAFISDRGIILRDDSGKAYRMVGAMADITLRREYEHSLERLNKTLEIRAKELASTNADLEQFAYIASHDLQEPLRMVTSFLTQLNRKYESSLDKTAHEYINFAVDGAKRMRQIILDLLEFSRIGKSDEDYEECELNDVIDEVLKLQFRLIEEKKAKVIVPNLPKVRALRTPLIQLFQNLIGNSLKYSKENINPVIEIVYKETDKEHIFSIIDNGIGIDEEYFDKIFILFQRLHKRNEYGGTGIGLAIVKKIVDLLNGKIWLESEVGEGSTFYFTLPRGLAE